MREGATAQAQLDAGQIFEARKTINSAIGRRDDIADLQLIRARIEFAANSPDTAFNAYAIALALDSGNAEALIGVARLGLRTGHLLESEKAADRALTLFPNQPDALLVKGLHNILRHRHEAALANADAILAQLPTNEEGAILRARALAMLGRSDEALEQLKKVQAARGNSFAISRNLLELYRQKGDARAMVQQFDVLRKFSPDDISLILDEANTLYKMGDVARARAFTHGLLFARSVDEANALLVTNLWNEYDPAPLDQATLTKVAAEANPAVRKTVARYYLDQRDTNHAQQALGPNAPDEDFAALSAQIAIARGQVAEGLAEADRILAKDQTHCDALVARAQADLAERKVDDAVIAGQSASSVCPKMAPTYLVLAQAHHAAKDDLAVDRVFRAAVTRNTQNSRLARTYAEWLEQNGKAMRAIAIARRLTRSAPSLVSGWTLFADLCARTPDADCVDEAKAGLADAKTRFGIDLRPDEQASVGLMARLDKE